MDTYPQLVPLLILIPFTGMLINFFWGAKLGEAWSSRVAILASSLTFVIALLLLAYLSGNHGQAAIVESAYS